MEICSRQNVSHFSKTTGNSGVNPTVPPPLGPTPGAPGSPADGYERLSPQLTAVPSAPTPAPLSGVQVPTSNLQKGSTNKAEVELLQKALVKLGYMTQAQMNTGPGTFGPATETALKNFQKANGLTADGLYGPNTRNKMVSLGATTGSSGSTSSSGSLSGSTVPASNLQKGSTNKAEVELLQKALVKLGYMTQAQMNTGPGTFGPATETALKNFQKANGLTADGVYGPNTRNKMVSMGATTSTSNSGGTSGTYKVDASKLQSPYNQWASYVEAAAKKYSLDPALIFAVMERESNGRNIKGDGGHGRGLMQIDDRSWGTWLAQNNGGMDPASNIMKGAEILRANLDYFKGDLTKAIAAYNAGCGGVNKAVNAGKHPDSATTGGNYSRDVIQKMDKFRAACTGTTK